MKRSDTWTALVVKDENFSDKKGNSVTVNRKHVRYDVKVEVIYESVSHCPHLRNKFDNLNDETCLYVDRQPTISSTYGTLS